MERTGYEKSTWREKSKGDWCSVKHLNNNREDTKAGALQRIADSLEELVPIVKTISDRMLPSVRDRDEEKIRRQKQASDHLDLIDKYVVVHINRMQDGARHDKSLPALLRRRAKFQYKTMHELINGVLGKSSNTATEQELASAQDRLAALTHIDVILKDPPKEGTKTRTELDASGLEWWTNR